MDSFVVHKNGEQLGPYTAEGLRQQLNAGHLLSGDMAWDKVRGEWVPVGQLAISTSAKSTSNKRLALIAIALGLVLGSAGMLIGWVGLRIIAEVREFDSGRPVDDFGQEQFGQHFEFNEPERNRLLEVQQFNPRPRENLQPVGNLELLKRHADAGNVNAQFRLGVCHVMGQGVRTDEDEAIKWYRKAVGQGHRTAMNNLAYTYACRGERLEEALKLIKQAMRVEDTPSFMHDTYGWVLFKMGDYRQSLNSLKTAVRLKPDWETLDHLGDCHFKQREADKAQQRWRDAIVMLESSTEPDVQTKLRRIRQKLKGVTF